MKRIVIAIPHSHSYFWTQTCISSLKRCPAFATYNPDYQVDVLVVNNSPWSPAIRGITDTDLKYDIQVVENYKTNKFHASALDCIVEKFQFDYLMALETDVMVLRPGWLSWFLNQMKHSDFAVGMWHHEQFVNPSCTLYRGEALREMNKWCKGQGFVLKYWNPPELGMVPKDELRWGENFSKSAPLDANLKLAENPAAIVTDMLGWIAGPFAEKRGFAEGTILKEPPSGQCKGPGWYEPGQQLHAWAFQAGWNYTVCPNMTTNRADGLPLQSLYGSEMPDPQRQLEAMELFGNAYAAHLWGGTRALDILKHEVTCEFVKANTPMWLAREARFWKQTVPEDIQKHTLELIREYGWHITGQGSDHISDRDRRAAEYVRECYKLGGVEW